MEISYITLERVIAIHQLCINLTPGEQTHILDKNALESALHQGGVAHAYLKNPDIFDVVSAVGWHLATAHSFANANKRTSYFATDAMLRANGYRLDVTHIS
jgi:death-on-curing family protein